MLKDSLVSIIVPTHNSADFLSACLSSIKNQTYQHIELIVVDRDSTDATKDIARRFTSHVYNHGPERSAQRNFGVDKATGEYVAIIDSDMELTPKVIEACIDIFASVPGYKGIIIPEESFGQGFWAKCKALERSFYVGNDAIEAVRFFPRSIYQELGGYDTQLVAGEDWDLSARLRRLGPTARIHQFIRHNEGHLSIKRTLSKKYYYAKHARNYLAKEHTSPEHTAAIGPLHRYRMFFSRPRTLFARPLIGLGLLVLKTAEYTSGAVGYLSSPKPGETSNE